MRLIVGLGNPGDKYDKTRHNLGFMVLDHLLEDLNALKKTFWENSKELKSLTSKVMAAGHEIILAKPQTYMNNSGEAVKRLISKNKLTSVDIIVIHDDLDLPLGKIRVRMGGAAAGHKGVESIIESLGTDKFLRVRVGIGKPIKKVEGAKFKIQNIHGVDDYVLSTFASSETGKVRTMLKETTRTVRLLIKEGLDKYMSKYNKK